LGLGGGGGISRPSALGSANLISNLKIGEVERPGVFGGVRPFIKEGVKKGVFQRETLERLGFLSRKGRVFWFGAGVLMGRNG